MPKGSCAQHQPFTGPLTVAAVSGLLTLGLRDSHHLPPGHVLFSQELIIGFSAALVNPSPSDALLRSSPARLRHSAKRNPDSIQPSGCGPSLSNSRPLRALCPVNGLSFRQIPPTFHSSLGRDDTLPCRRVRLSAWRLCYASLVNGERGCSPATSDALLFDLRLLTSRASIHPTRCVVKWSRHNL